MSAHASKTKSAPRSTVPFVFILTISDMSSHAKCRQHQVFHCPSEPVLHILYQLTSTCFSLALHRALLQNSYGPSQLTNKSLLMPALSSSGLYQRAVAETRLVREESKRCEQGRQRTEKKYNTS